MSISVSCSACGKSYRVGDDKAGRRFSCKACGERIKVPDFEDEWEDEYADDDYGVDGFSDDYGDGDDDNPYSAPSSRSGGGSGRKNAKTGGKARAKSRLIGPAICLYIVAGLSTVNHVWGLVSSLLGHGFALPGQQIRPQDETLVMVVGITVTIIVVLIDVLVIVGAYNMQTLKSHSLAMTAAILACIPCCGPCVVLGIPFGIWALVVLNDQSVKNAFG